MSYKIYPDCIKKNDSNELFKYILSLCNFYKPGTFKSFSNYSKTWTDPKFIKSMQKLRNSKRIFSSIYDSIQVSNELQKIPFNSRLDKIATDFLKVKNINLLIRGIQFRIDFPNDSRNSYGWHQDNAYDQYNTYSKNGVVLWIPLIDTNENNGTLIIKPGSELSSFNCSKRFYSGDKYKSEQILVLKKYLNKYKSLSVDVKKNHCLATYCGIFHKSGVNISNHIRFTMVVRYNNQLSKDFLFYRNLKNVK
tara:strand:- start:239 stop:988 length:750 start_codon:yes stop_codon:yes gene_type:complete